MKINFKEPEIKKDTKRFYHIPGWFATMNIKTFKKKFGFSIKSGTWQYINISVIASD